MHKEHVMRIGSFLLAAVGLLLAAYAALVGTGCAGDGESWSGEDLAGMKLTLHSANEGIYPDKSVLGDPDNPFAGGSIGEDTIWKIQSSGNIVAAFYAWSTACARGASGERQYYAALDLKAIYEQNMAVEADMPLVRDLAIRGFQSVLDNFPDAVTYDATGTIAWDLATPSVEGILDLGGKVLGGWVIVQTENGGKMAVRR
jgi:hypothetical protein